MLSESQKVWLAHTKAREGFIAARSMVQELQLHQRNGHESMGSHELRPPCEGTTFAPSQVRNTPPSVRINK